LCGSLFAGPKEERGRYNNLPTGKNAGYGSTSDATVLPCSALLERIMCAITGMSLIR
jgi:hypothetical protein